MTVKNDKPHYGLKEHTSVDINNGFILATTMSTASVHDTNYFQYCTVYSRHTSQPIKKAFADKAYFGEPNRAFLNMNNIEDGNMRKDTTTAKFTPLNMFLEHLLKEIYPVGLSNISMFCLAFTSYNTKQLNGAGIL